MELQEAMRNRKSCRAFLNKEIPREILTRILEDVIQAPSAINMQPWLFTVVSGDEKPRLSRNLMKAYAERKITCGSGSTSPLPEAVQRRRSEAGAGMAPLFKEMGVEPGRFINEGSLNFYNAPTAVIVSFDRAFTEKRYLDMGIAIGYLLLSAQAHNLGACPLGLVCDYADVIRETLNIPESHLIALSVALGYPDTDSPVNRFKSSRDGLDSFARWYD